MRRTPWWQEHEAAGHLVLQSESPGTRISNLVSVLFLKLATPAHRMALSSC